MNGVLRKLIDSLDLYTILGLLASKGIPTTGKNVMALKAEIANHIERAWEDFKA